MRNSKNILFKVKYNGKCFDLFPRNKTRCNVLADGSRWLGAGENKCFDKIYKKNQKM